MRVLCIAKKEWSLSEVKCSDPKYGDICTVVREFESFGYRVYELVEFPHAGGYDVRGFMPISDIDERERLEAWQSEHLTQEDKLFKELADTMSEKELPLQPFERGWRDLVLKMEGAL